MQAPVFEMVRATACAQLQRSRPALTVDSNQQARSVNMFTNRYWQLLRWLCVLPAAIVVGTAAKYVLGLLAMALRTASLSAFGTWGRWLFGIGHVPMDAAVVFAAAMVAPRH